MRLPEILMKAVAIILFGLGTILALFSSNAFATDPQRGKQIAVAAFVLYVLGGMFFVFPPVQDWIAPRRRSRRESGIFHRDRAKLAGTPPADDPPKSE